MLRVDIVIVLFGILVLDVLGGVGFRKWDVCYPFPAATVTATTSTWNVARGIFCPVDAFRCRATNHVIRGIQ